MKLAKNKANVIRANETPAERKQREKNNNFYDSFLNQSAAAGPITRNHTKDEIKSTGFNNASVAGRFLKIVMKKNSS